MTLDRYGHLMEGLDADVAKRLEILRRTAWDGLTGKGLRTPTKAKPNRPVTCGDARGADRTRTDDFLLAKQALYQLSYGPAPRFVRFTRLGRANFTILGS